MMPSSAFQKTFGATSFVAIVGCALVAGCQHTAIDVPGKPTTTTTYGSEAGADDDSGLTDPGTFVGEDAGITPAPGWAKDPPPQYCGPNPSEAPQPPGGTV